MGIKDEEKRTYVYKQSHKLTRRIRPKPCRFIGPARAGPGCNEFCNIPGNEAGPGVGKQCGEIIKNNAGHGGEESLLCSLGKLVIIQVQTG